MATAVPLDAETDNTRIALVLRGSITLAVLQAVFVVIVSIITRLLGGTAEHALTGVVVFVGAMVTIFYPGTLTRPRTIDGISSAAGIGLGATWIFLLIDAFVLQSFHIYTNRWYQVGGGSFWWYLPVWWMVGTYLSWMGAWILANQANQAGKISLLAGVALVTGVVGRLRRPRGRDALPGRDLECADLRRRHFAGPRAGECRQRPGRQATLKARRCHAALRGCCCAPPVGCSPRWYWSALPALARRSDSSSPRASPRTQHSP